MTKNLEPGCTGGVLCEVAGHVTARQNKSGTKMNWRHISLTTNQRRQLIKNARRESCSDL